MINRLSQEIHQNAKEKGFYEDPPSVPKKIALIHSELSEALEADRADRWDNMHLVLDVLQDFAAFHGIDLEAHIEAKMFYNKNRKHKHGNKKY